MRISRTVGSLFGKFSSGWQKVAVGGLVVGILIVLLPPLYGEGYMAMRSMLTDNMASLFTDSAFAGLLRDGRILPFLLIAIALIKPIATAATTASGGIGGTFAPTLFVGCAIGYAFAGLCNLTGIAQLPPMNFALAGMAGALSGIMAAPLTGIFLIAELTGGYQLLVPLIIVATLSTAITRRFEPYSIYTRPLGQTGHLITHHRDQAALTLLRIRDLVEKDRPSISPDTSIAELRRMIAENPFPYYSVVDEKSGFAGLIDVQDILPALAKPEIQEFIILSDLVHEPKRKIDASMDAHSAFQAFADSSEEELPVFDHDVLIGFLTRARLYAAYKGKMAEIFEGDEI